jgi:hypothetical protein
MITFELYKKFKKVDYHSLDDTTTITGWRMYIQTMTDFANGLDYVSV